MSLKHSVHSIKFIIAPDSFKESLSAEEVARAIATGIKQILPNAECVCIPLADGGEGTAKTLCAAREGDWHSVVVQNPLGNDTTAYYAILPNQCAVIEMAQAAGLALITPEERNPLLTSTYGVGEMIRDALYQGVRKFIIAIGGSATNDGGSGMLAALGVKFYDKNNQIIPLGAQSLMHLSHVDLTGLDERLLASKITIACDVNNPLLGESGASAIFAPQKGADTAMVKLLDDALAHYSKILVESGFCDHRTTAGSGAAGGLGFALLGLPNTTIESGIELVIRESGFIQACQDADYIITGEGCMDNQTLLGKVPMGVLACSYNHEQSCVYDCMKDVKYSPQKNIPVIAICGCLGESQELLNKAGFTAIFPIIPYLADQQHTLDCAKENLIRTARNIASIIKVSV